MLQKKADFGAPADHWLAHDLRPTVDQLLSEDASRRRGLFEPHAVRALIDEDRAGRHDWSLQILQFLTFELWMQTLLDRR